MNGRCKFLLVTVSSYSGRNIIFTSASQFLSEGINYDKRMVENILPDIHFSIYMNLTYNIIF